jgi:predicted nuclease of predicted toxin-antitoxin system
MASRRGIPRRLATWLREQGGDVLVVAESEYRGRPDSLLWQVAGRERRLVVTRDRGFLCPALTPPPPGVLVVRVPPQWRAADIVSLVVEIVRRLGPESLVGKITVLEPQRVRQRPLPL